MVPSDLSPDQARRFRLWCALTELIRAQEAGQLSPDQARLLRELADCLDRLATQLAALADLGQQLARLLDADAPAPDAAADR